LTPLINAEFDHFLNFIGCGNLRSGVWWHGIEEGADK
jgi:hypothetical protein